MARRKARMTVGGKYVAIGALAEVINTVRKLPRFENDWSPQEWAEEIIAASWDVEHFPVAGKVQITLDLGRLDQPADQPGPDAMRDPVAGRDYEPNATP